MYFGKKIVSLQFTSTSGEKRFLSGGRTKDCFYFIGEINEESPICITEGFATGATIHQATNALVIVAFNCNNLKSVAKTARGKYPDSKIILCADDDFKTEGNPGRSKANDAAIEVNAKVAIPKFEENRSEDATDFNDMAILHGIEQHLKVGRKSSG